MFNKKKINGFTLVEIVVALGIFSLIVLAASSILITSLRSNQIIWNQLSTQNEGRKVLQEVVNDVRRAEESSTGGYPIVLAQEYELIFYANIDTDSEREQIHFWLEDGILKKGIINPSGNPLIYNSDNEEVVELAHFVKNEEISSPVFSYFDESYTGSEDALVIPTVVTSVHLVRVQLDLEEDPNKSPVLLHVESSVHVRNLKTN
ncbi:prepilin-type N-terminal cleavage/methylation domain-containing protein [Patescibacteria group bacterium]|nr:prepilin-type N-terminal cleavage/methylation domain-containing protein [Patescibacteria group bacterium]MBU1895344.1 prepilin-type N-terminal cleavage/methylation domain-containing protein [Patescibacteria group bacterium]